MLIIYKSQFFKRFILICRSLNSTTSQFRNFTVWQINQLKFHKLIQHLKLHSVHHIWVLIHSLDLILKIMYLHVIYVSPAAHPLPSISPTLQSLPSETPISHALINSRSINNTLINNSLINNTLINNRSINNGIDQQQIHQQYIDQCQMHQNHLFILSQLVRNGELKHAFHVNKHK